MTAKKTANDLHGKTLRFNFDDGPMKGKAFDHVFNKDGTASWGEADGKATKAEHAGIEKIGDGCYTASYLGAKGYTLTTTFNLDTGELVSFASDGKEWSVQHGRVELKA
ncbi:MAG: MoaF N-terminal domain-containing protein [Dokdonella sp.]